MDSLRINSDEWKQASSNVFWGELAPCDHVVQIYENDDVFLDLLNGFVSGGVNSGDSVIVIATPSHLGALNSRLENLGFNISDLRSKNLYLPVDAEQMLSEFMVNDWPDETLFMSIVSDLIAKAKMDNRQVRAFGEMVAILWAKGQVGATVRLEHLWNKFCESQAFCLFCAYPESGFTQDASESVMHICGAHSKMISGAAHSTTDVYYKPVSSKMAG
jgi:hypothetical protein